MSWVSDHFSSHRNNTSLSTPPLELVKAPDCFHRNTKGYWGQGEATDLSRTNVNEKVAKFVLQLLETRCSKNKKFPFQIVDLTLFSSMIARKEKKKKGDKIYASNALEQWSWLQHIKHALCHWTKCKSYFSFLKKKKGGGRKDEKLLNDSIFYTHSVYCSLEKDAAA